MKILIVSDTHRRDGNLQTVIEKTAPFDMLIHLGDAEGSEDRIETWCREQNENCQVHMILGNNDFFQSGEGKGDFHWRLQGFFDSRTLLQRVGGDGASGG